ncbi:putative membrane protein [Amycolatopsis echigonensis]|uniref:Membrane protein n=1 Tax=Amycolatopsis echigonensis TaxID=2576905 RepID=A0A2N3WJA6_9PSEU|nr:DUF1772 domain-containing protein [Amycolatopsis niigatensis]PKV93953.1 putative membrane protein [Amycolatopsis niigatensis]
MSLLAQIISVAVLLLSTTVAGTFFAVAVSVFPTLQQLPPQQYVRTQRLLGKGYHPIMPILVSAVLLGDVLLSLLADGIAPKVCFAIAAVLFAGVPAISQFGNLPLNKAIEAADVNGVPAEGWQDPRPAWRGWHLLRSVLAFVVAGLNIVTAVMVA